MPDQTPAELANQTAEAIRAINHLTMSPRDGWTYPSDAYSVVGGLSRMAMMLPQALDQIGALIEPSDTGGHLYSDKGTLAADLENTYGGLADAHDAAKALYEALNRAHSGLSPIAYKD
ncbi:hypothetical protein [Streptomyces scabiei]|uniref:hypothetical protein n=1 Tax=Streptomyces scabiei TaxID=1930 RepID=UPI000765E9B3|nr:hypothetical protein [Streptomyces scabiei]MDX2997988.1 hypothetical protein [Streptomyces scabiei]MDX3051608.1 hypothetical protein [Streptomyces scabiei]